MSYTNPGSRVAPRWLHLELDMKKILSKTCLPSLHGKCTSRIFFPIAVSLVLKEKHE